MPDSVQSFPGSIGDIADHAHSRLSGVTAAQHHTYPHGTAGLLTALTTYSGVIGAGVTFAWNSVFSYAFMAFGTADAANFVTMTEGTDFLGLANRGGAVMTNTDAIGHSVSVSRRYITT